MVYITVLDYGSGQVIIHSINSDLEDTIDNYEDYLTNQLGYKLNEISYMVSDTLQLQIK